jgi:hypothetical protein
MKSFPVVLFRENYELLMQNALTKGIAVEWFGKSSATLTSKRSEMRPASGLCFVTSMMWLHIAKDTRVKLTAKGRLNMRLAFCYTNTL